jgi:hypothetical protein
MILDHHRKLMNIYLTIKLATIIYILNNEQQPSMSDQTFYKTSQLLPFLQLDALK